MTDVFLEGLAPAARPASTVEQSTETDGGFRPLPEIVLGQTGVGRGDSYRPAPGWPSLGHLEYVQKFSVVTLIAVAIVALAVYAVINPRRAARAVAETAKRRAGVE